MKKILIIGAGKSCAHLIRFLAHNTDKHNYSLIMLDLNFDLIPYEIKSLKNCQFNTILTADEESLSPYIHESDITISMLPASFHPLVARTCLHHKSHLITPSYISEEMKCLNNEVLSNDLIFLNEMGFDPGIDHMTTMKIYHEIIDQGGEIISYKSYAGGLVAKDSDNNPWHYKFSWNPRNVILAGQGGDIVYKELGIEKKISYSSLFSNSTEIKLKNGLTFDAYANRDSLRYQTIYEWKNTETILRGTLRYPGFCQAWSILVSLGLTDEKIQMESFEGKSFKDFYQYFIKNQSIEEFLGAQNIDIQEKLISIGWNDSDSIIKTSAQNSAKILQYILEPKWKLENEDTDWVVMVHFIEYKIGSKHYKIESSLSLEGESNLYTAMSKTVGMPIAYAALLILENKIKSRGVLLPVKQEIYTPIIEALENDGILFQEFIEEIT